MDSLQLTGRTNTHVAPAPDGSALMHPSTMLAFTRIRKAALADGIDISIVSAFRPFDRQRAIWNAKWNGQRPLYDASGRLLDHSSLTPRELVHAILTWSALPGASRHHWGSDLDVIDAAACPPDYQVQLLPHEFLPGGPFHRMHQWLTAHITEFGFFFPYQHQRNGVSPEPWHISHAPVAKPALRELTLEMLSEAIDSGEVAGAKIIHEILPDLYQRYVLNIEPEDTAKR